MATLRGPSFSGPLSGWTAASLVPNATAPAPVPAATPTRGAGIRRALNLEPEAASPYQWSADGKQLLTADGQALEPFINPADGKSQLGWVDPTTGKRITDLIPLTPEKQAEKDAKDFENAKLVNLTSAATMEDWVAAGKPRPPTYLGHVWDATNGSWVAGPNAVPTAPPPGTTPATLAARSRRSPFGGVPVGSAGGGGVSIAGSASSDLSRYDLKDSDFGGGGSRTSTYTPTPLESLLSSMFPEAAADFDPTQTATGRTSGPAPSLLDTILGNLGSVGGGASGYGLSPVYQPSYGAQLSATIPGAPPFLANAINRVSGTGFGVPSGGPVRGGFGDLGGLAAISAEQRIQKAELDRARAESEANYLKSQQKIQQDAAKRQQIQRQKLSPVSGWATNPTFY